MTFRYLERFGIVAVIVAAGLILRAIAAGAETLATLMFVIGLALASRSLTRPSSTTGGALPTPFLLQSLTRSTRGAEARIDRNLLLLMLVVVPLSALLHEIGMYVQRSVRGYPTESLRLTTSWDFVKHFQGGPANYGLFILAGGLVYEVLLRHLHPRATTAENDRRALALLPVIAAPVLLLSRFALLVDANGIALAQGLLIYFFVVRQFPAESTTRSEAGLLDEPLPRDDEPYVAPRAIARRRRYALFGAALGAAIAVVALISAGVGDPRTLAVAAEQMVFLALPVSLPLRAAFFYGDAMQWESAAKLVTFIVATPVANGLFLGWLGARAVEAYERRSASRSVAAKLTERPPEEKRSAIG